MSDKVECDDTDKENVARKVIEEGGGGEIKNVTNEEAELYDRQIRLWGLEAQSRVRNARVLIVGLRGLHAEVRE